MKGNKLHIWRRIMDRTENEEYIIGCICLLSNKIIKFGDQMLPDITFRQWFLLLMISKMSDKEKNINSIAAFTGTTRQNVKKLLTPLESKGYVIFKKSSSDARALQVELTEKTNKYFAQNAESAAAETDRLFSSFSDAQINSLKKNLGRLLSAF